MNPPPKLFDALAHRRNDNYAAKTFVWRILWIVGAFIFRCVPRPFYGLRNTILRLFGARLGKSVRVYPSVEVFYPWNVSIGDFATIGPRTRLYSLGKIEIGPECLVSQNVHFCAGTHDYRALNLPLRTPPIVLGRGVWVCADVFVGPGVRVRDYAILAARAVVVKEVPAAAIVGGNPAKVIGDRRTGFSGKVE